MIIWCPEGDLNPHDRLRSADFKSAVSADFTIRAFLSSPSYPTRENVKFAIDRPEIEAEV